MGKRATSLGALVLLMLSATLGVGCQEGGATSQRQSGGPAYQKWNSEGDRLLVRNEAGEPRYKLRVRSTNLKVYDRNFRALGYVETRREETDAKETADDADAQGAAGSFEIRVRRLERGRADVFRKLDRGVWGIEGGVRIERTADGWAVFDENADWIGQLEQSRKGGWRLERGRDDSIEWSVEQGDGQVVVRADGETRLTAPNEELAPETLLALALDELPLLERVAVGRWMTQLRSD